MVRQLFIELDGTGMGSYGRCNVLFIVRVWVRFFFSSAFSSFSSRRRRGPAGSGCVPVDSFPSVTFLGGVWGREIFWGGCVCVCLGYIMPI